MTEPKRTCVCDEPIVSKRGGICVTCRKPIPPPQRTGDIVTESVKPLSDDVLDFLRSLPQPEPSPPIEPDLHTLGLVTWDDGDYGHTVVLTDAGRTLLATIDQAVQQAAEGERRRILDGLHSDPEGMILELEKEQTNGN